MRQKIIDSLKDNIKIKNDLIENHIDVIVDISKKIIKALKNKKKILIFGNGGSAADSQHMAAELVGRFKKEKRPLPVISLNTNTSIITSLANDYGYADIFSKQLEALGGSKDVAIGISTSGNSPNILKAIKLAKEKGLITIGLTGKRGKKLASLCDTTLMISSSDTPRIQEAHITCIHIICDLIEREFTKDK